MVRRALVLVGLLLLAIEAQAAVVVLKGGKRLDVASYTQKGNYVVVKYQSGRFESYPLSAVDLEATKIANGVKDAAPTPTPSGPHSPFLVAKSTAGASAVIVTDSDVGRFRPVEAAAEGEAMPAGEGAGRVVMAGYEKKQVGEGEWEVAVTAGNPGAELVQAVNLTVRALDATGKQLAAATGILPGDLAGGKQAVITVKIAASAEPVQFGFDFSWYVPPKPTPTPTAAPKSAKPASRPAAETAAAQPVPGMSIPAGSSPNAVPSNPMGVVPVPQTNATQVPSQQPPPTR
jgi:hypothetical protein